MNGDLQINPKFEQIIPPLSEDEFERLEINILTQGRITDPIKIWNGVIVDGHHRYKVILMHPEIPYTTYEMSFKNEYDAIAWICNNQLGRRNLTEPHKRYLIGKMYNTEKIVGFYIGNQYTLPKKSGVGRSDPPQNSHGKRSEVATFNGVSESYVKRAACFAEGVDAADEVYPGIKKQILSEEIEVSIPELTAIAKMPPEERRSAVELLFVPKSERAARVIAKQVEEDFKNEADKNEEDEITIEPIRQVTVASNKPNELTESPEKTAETRTRDIEESIIHSMYGTLNMFIESINDYLTRFPRLITEPKYRDQTRELMVAAKKYIKDVEGELK